jgi:hypothetical protein
MVEVVKQAVELLAKDPTTRAALDILGGYVIGKVLDHYVRVPAIVKIKLPDLSGKIKSHRYEGKKLVYEYWRDLLGEEYGLFPGSKKSLWAGHRVIFRDVVVTDFVPRAPGFYYSKNLWANPKLAPLSLGVIKLLPRRETDSKMLLAIHKPSEFEAHAEIEKGIPIVVSKDIYEKLGEPLQKYGSIRVSSITAMMSDIGEYSSWLKMADMPYTFPVVMEESGISKIGHPAPIMGNGWNIYTTTEKIGFVNFRFWAGVDYHIKSLEDAKVAIDRLIPPEALILADFDEKVSHWPKAPLRLSEIWQHLYSFEGEKSLLSAMRKTNI